MGSFSDVLPAIRCSAVPIADNVLLDPCRNFEQASAPRACGNGLPWAAPREPGRHTHSAAGKGAAVRADVVRIGTWMSLPAVVGNWSPAAVCFSWW
jgi:hypothetical protein